MPFTINHCQLLLIIVLLLIIINNTNINILCLFSLCGDCNDDGAVGCDSNDNSIQYEIKKKRSTGPPLHYVVVFHKQ